VSNGRISTLLRALSDIIILLTFFQSRATQKHLEKVTPEFVKKDDRPPQSPDFKPSGLCNKTL